MRACFLPGRSEAYIYVAGEDTVELYGAWSAARHGLAKTSMKHGRVCVTPLAGTGVVTVDHSSRTACVIPLSNVIATPGKNTEVGSLVFENADTQEECFRLPETSIPELWPPPMHTRIHLAARDFNAATPSGIATAAFISALATRSQSTSILKSILQRLWVNLQQQKPPILPFEVSIEKTLGSRGEAVYTGKITLDGVEVYRLPLEILDEEPAPHHEVVAGNALRKLLETAALAHTPYWPILINT